MFWSGERLAERLPGLVSPFDSSQIDCAAYTLAVGPEVYVSPTDQASDPAKVTARKLADGEAFTVPPGQFAFLLTEQTVAVPHDAIAFISIKSRTKFRGLVNVSGFHVDPGYKGRLLFAVFNAGPLPVHLKRGQPVFLIWYADLDRQSSNVKIGPGFTDINPELLSTIAGELQSFASLSAKIKDVETELTNKIHSVEKEQTFARVIGTIALAITLAILGGWLRGCFGEKADVSQVRRSGQSTQAQESATRAPIGVSGTNRSDSVIADTASRPITRSKNP